MCRLRQPASRSRSADTAQDRARWLPWIRRRRIADFDRAAIPRRSTGGDASGFRALGYNRSERPSAVKAAGCLRQSPRDVYSRVTGCRASWLGSRGDARPIPGCRRRSSGGPPRHPPSSALGTWRCRTDCRSSPSHPRSPVTRLGPLLSSWKRTSPDLCPEVIRHRVNRSLANHAPHHYGHDNFTETSRVAILSLNLSLYRFELFFSLAVRLGRRTE
ncbi:hypothetical protein MHPYR_470058 [uncultured Mycobacterium sp.]|uniref:Uncharacterized protein n=1 Tax=uncultured Mycobacterium sp. TaxID=171292 RepID=A0A1Y5PGC1_9MYCO|nr:hypothetical protein MHPYR_470058 [uncultured Mycobacterium sp.]